jgi:hypothetical protein
MVLGSFVKSGLIDPAKNRSDPPRTQMHDKDSEFFLPDGAEIDQAPNPSPTPAFGACD